MAFWVSSLVYFYGNFFNVRWYVKLNFELKYVFFVHVCISMMSFLVLVPISIFVPEKLEFMFRSFGEAYFLYIIMWVIALALQKAINSVNIYKDKK